MATSNTTFQKENEKIQELQTKLQEVYLRLEPLNDNVDTLDQKFFDYKKTASKQLSKLLTKLGQEIGLDPQTTIEFCLEDRYNKINVVHPSGEKNAFNASIEIELKNFDRYQCFRKDEDMKVFNQKEAIFELRANAHRFYQDNIQEVDTHIFLGYIAKEFRNFNKEESFFDNICTHMVEMYSISDSISNARTPVYEVQSEASSLENEIKKIDTAIEDGKFVQEIKESIGDTFVLKQNVDLYRGRNVKNIGNLFGDDYHITHMQVMKVTDKTVTFYTGYLTDGEGGFENDLRFNDTRRIKKSDLKRDMQYIEKVDISDKTVTNYMNV